MITAEFNLIPNYPIIDLDNIFKNEDIFCVKSDLNNRIYQGKSEKVSMEDFMSSLIDIRENKTLRIGIISAILRNDDEEIDLVKDCFDLIIN